MLTMEAALALIPLFGPVAISSRGKDVHVIDGSESVDMLRQRLRERAEATMKELADVMGELNKVFEDAARVGSGQWRRGRPLNGGCARR
jgi:hypothetical protein